MTAAALPRVSPSEYLRMERASDSRHEFYQGEIFAMSGGSPNHSLIQVNLARELSSRLKGSRCTPYNADLRIKIPDTGLYTYPDLSVFCDDMLFDDAARDTALNPTVLFEVLSPSTEKWDRGGKFAQYRTLPSLREVVFIAQDAPRVELFLREPGSWRLTEAIGLNSVARLESLQISLPLAEIFDRIAFPDPPRPRA